MFEDDRSICWEPYFFMLILKVEIPQKETIVLSEQEDGP